MAKALSAHHLQQINDLESIYHPPKTSMGQ